MEPYLPNQAAVNRQTFTWLYDTYAPTLWGIILKAGVEPGQGETILVGTFAKACQAAKDGTLRQDCGLAQLLRIAYGQGLPVDCLQTFWPPK